MISAIIQNLNRGINLLSSISDADYANNSTAPYYSSIGIHMRHILDVFSCIFDGLETLHQRRKARIRGTTRTMHIVGAVPDSWSLAMGFLDNMDRAAIKLSLSERREKDNWVEQGASISYCPSNSFYVWIRFILWAGVRDFAAIWSWHMRTRFSSSSGTDAVALL